VANLDPEADRAVSITVTYAIALVITTVVVATLLTAASGFLTGQREEVVRDGFRNVGHTLAGDLETADRLNRSMEPSASIQIDTRLPSTIGGRDYNVVVRNRTPRTTDGPTAYQIRLHTREPRIVHTVGFNASSHVDTSAVDGGAVRIRSTANGSLEVVSVNASA
jgi:hypothetical protein